MNTWNWKLFNDYKTAAHELDLEIVQGWSYYSIKLPNPQAQAWLWTPLNKISCLIDEGSPEQALHHLKDNQSDFHLEFDTSNYQHSIIFYEHWNKNGIGKDSIKRAIEMLMDIDYLNKQKLLTSIKYSEA